MRLIVEFNIHQLNCFCHRICQNYFKLFRKLVALRGKLLHMPPIDDEFQKRVEDALLPKEGPFFFNYKSQLRKTNGISLSLVVIVFWKLPKSRCKLNIL